MYYKEDNLAKRADSLQLKLLQGKLQSVQGELESCGDLISELESLELQVTDIEEVMRSKEQEVAVLQQAIEQEREPENQEVLSNSGKQIEVSKTEEEPATKAFWFAETFGLEVESITTRTSNDGNELVIPLGSQQGKHPSLVPATSTAQTDRNCHSNDFVPAGAVWSR